MKNLVKYFITLLVSFSADVIAEDNPGKFFQIYMQLGESFDANVANLYDDSAKIHAYRVYPHGLERNMELSGAQWKELVKKLMPIARAKNDKSTFSDINILEVEGGYKIKANRYSERKCYTDTGYYMILKNGDDGNLAIFEEYMETKPLPDC
ncbi:hypothetical protein [Microbulbifer taiwanensis]|uniref:Nuclear transport factor 2 family protein n=1 Tax=Microbulbifer taiwanensis TaxID=986746 RepID=A0ABW1YKY3_9GAMM|nr:hypothetical protein [Microbulbifer taiwanensis]